MKRTISLFAMLALLLMLAACDQTPTPQPATATPVPPADTPVAPQSDSADIVETVAAMETLSTLSQAIVEADLVEKLSSDGPYTIFAPTDAAFDALPAEIRDDPELMFDLLLYHIVNQRLTAADAAQQATTTSLLGDELQFSLANNTLLVNDVSVVAADIEAANGFIHTIETALIPPTLGVE